MSRSNGPAVVAIGGGHGLSSSLRAVRIYAASITAIVSVADDGGSSGRLRTDFGMAAPGDIRRCLSALAADGSLLGGALEHRFARGDLAGHALGNLLLAGLAESSGTFEAAVEEVARLVGAVGRVVPATSEPVELVGEGSAGRVAGEVAIKKSGVETVHIEPETVGTPLVAVDAILAADQVVLGPGSLYTSVLAAAVAPAVRAALEQTSAQRVYVCNLRHEAFETLAHDAADHVAALARHGIPIDVVLRHPGALPGAEIAAAVVEAPVADTRGQTHDPVLLGAALGDLASESLRARAPSN